MTRHTRRAQLRAATPPGVISIATKAHRRQHEIHIAVKRAMEIDRRLPEESDLDHAKRLGLLGEPHTVSDLLGCRFCAGLPWRRHLDNCKGCGGKFEPETLERPDFSAVSNAGYMDGSRGLGNVGITKGRSTGKKIKVA